MRKTPLKSLSSLALLGVAGGCSLFYQLNTTQCETTDDCRALGAPFANTTCTNRVCVPNTASGGTGPTGMGGADNSGGSGNLGGSQAGAAGASGASGAAGAPQCVVNQDCYKEQLLDPYVCRRNQCVPLYTDDCPLLLGEGENYENLKVAEPVLFGAFAQMDPTNWAGNTHVMNYRLAIEEFNEKTGGGLQTTRGKRPFVAVVCQSLSPNIPRTMNHLVGELEVPAILSSLGPKDLLEAFNTTDPFGPNPIFFMSAVSASYNLQILDDNGMVWHMLGDPTTLAKPTVALLKRAETHVQALRQQLYDADTNNPKLAEDPASVPLRVALIYGDYSTFQDISTVLQFSADVGLTFNGGLTPTENAANGNFQAVEIETAVVHTDHDPNVDNGVMVLNQMRPHIIIAQTYTELFKFVVPQVDDATWPTTKQPRPFYLLGNGLVSRITGTQADVNSVGTRLAGVNYATVTDRQLYDEYLVRLKGDNVGTTLNLEGTENYYDATYYLLYSFAAARNRIPFKGTDLAAALETRVIRGTTPVDVGPLAIQSGIPATLFGGDPNYSIVLKGTMGMPNFTTAGTRKTPTSVWCMQRAGLAGWQFRLDVLAYDEEAKELTGTFPCISGF